ncbi:MAG: signal peptidase I [Candidatus Hydrogenedentota bacterium]
MTEEQQKKKSFIRDTIETIVVAGTLALIIRALIVQPFYVPSSSMMPNIHGGVSLKGEKANDHLFAIKFIFGWRIPKNIHFKGWKPYFDFLENKIFDFCKPERGEIIIFEYPNNPSVDFVKRVAALPGDVIEMKNNIVYVNGKKLPRNFVSTYSYSDQEDPTDITQCNMYEEENTGVKYMIIQRVDDGRERKSSFGKIVVPEGHYFVLGDNRDNSQDSRIWGFVPGDRIKGKPLFIYWPISRWGLIK